MIRHLQYIIIALLFSLAANASASTYWLSHCAGEIAAKADPVLEGNATVRVAEKFDNAETATLAGNSITRIRFGIVSKLKIDNVRVWIASSLDSAPLVSIDIPKAELKSGWNEVILDKPLPVDVSALFAGYSFEQPSKCNVISTVPSAGNSSVWIDSGEGWKEITGETAGPLSIEIGVEGDNLIANDVAITSFTPEYPEIETFSSAFFKAEISNTGIEPVSTLTYTISHPSGSTEGTLRIEEIAPREKGTLFLKLPMGEVCSGGEAELSILAVNGSQLASPRKAGSRLDVMVAPLLRHRVLIEEFSNENCGNCPDATKRIHNVISGLENPASVDLAIHHAGSDYDSFTIEASKEYETFYSKGKYSPMAMFNRMKFNGAVEVNPSDVVTIESALGAAFARDPQASLSIEPFIDYEKGLIEVAAHGYYSGNSNLSLILFLTENNVLSIHQSGAERRYMHQNMLRATGDPWGKAIETDFNGYFSISGQVKFDSEWKKQDCRIIAFLTDNNPDSDSFREVLQSISLPLSYAEEKHLESKVAVNISGQRDQPGIRIAGGKISVDQPYSSLRIFRADGSEADTENLTHGIYIVRIIFADGSSANTKIIY